MNYVVTRLIFVLLGLCFSTQLHAQLNGDFIDESQHIYLPFTISNYGTRHGLPQNQVHEIAAKKDGELIIVTANGIVSFDGQNFDPFIQDNTYLRSLCNSIFYDELSGKVYANENSELFVQIHPNFKEIHKASSIFQVDRFLFFTDFDGTVYRFSMATQSLERIFSSPVSHCYSLYIHQGVYYMSNSTGLYRIENQGKTIAKLSSTFFVKVKFNPYDGKLYGITDRQLFEVTTVTTNEVSLPPVQNTTYFRDLEFTSEGDIYVASTTGLYYHHPYYTEVYDEETFFPTHHFESLHFNPRENCLFLGSTNKGLFKLTVKNCGSFGVEGPLSQVALCSVTENSAHKVFFAGTNNMIYSFGLEGEHLELDLSDQSLASMSIIRDHFLIGTWGNGALLYDKNKQFIRQIKSPELSRNEVFSAYEDKNNVCWIGHFDGISKETSNFQFQPYLPKLIKGKVLHFYELKNGDLCIGGTEGLYILDAKRNLKKHYTSQQIPCKEIRSFYEDKEGKLWIGTYNGGLFCLEKNKITCINKLKNCKLPYEIFTLVHDEQGELYISSNLGLWVIKEQQLNDFYRGKLPYLIPFVYGNETGIFNTEFNGGFQNNFLQSQFGHIYFPSIQGLVAFTPEELKFYKIKPKLRALYINNEQVLGPKHSFNQHTRSVEFFFQTPHFINKYNLHYQFALVGPSKKVEWTELSKNGNIRFDFLPHGKYTLKVRAIDAFNDPRPSITSFDFEILPAWYQTWWFYLLCFFCVIAMTVLIIRLRLISLEKREYRKNQINNSLLELKLKAIQAKMNPHFMFNTLNNIQFLIIQNKTEEAELALNQFSLLLRKFLQQSDYSFIRLSDELDLIELYLSIENFRFNNEMEIEMNIHPSVKNWVIPTLLIQPIVENAIKHGLAHSKTSKKLTISAQPNEFNQLIIIIEDNGIGRKAADIINSFRTNHISKGRELVRQKIQMINDKYSISITKKIMDSEAFPTGTKVIFKLPKIENELLNS